VELDAVAGEAVDVGGADVGVAVGGEEGVGVVVGEEEEDVGAGGGGGLTGVHAGHRTE
jgi:hypothetical protein